MQITSNRHSDELLISSETDRVHIFFGAQII